jgi:hypothetical protein
LDFIHGLYTINILLPLGLLYSTIFESLITGRKMFHDGDLQSGISRAIQEQKLVACFVRQGI